MLKHGIGKRSNKVKNTVERGAVKKFAEAIGDLHPIFICEETGKQSRYNHNIAPPTFPRVFDYGTIEELNLPSKGLIHGEQIYHYERPLMVGEDIQCYSEVKDYYERNGKSGEMGFLLLKRYGEDLEGNLIFTEEQVVIITEAVRKEMMV
ncbi:MaoC family dehydratase N-terminal domain-containing protein [Halobacillus amylolyticus]|uniref:MaoC family dehydratase N-terminal domain-containing protein n=1 Tax=Halobacillus amylolyticus TaxID=2932259 RepID=A0ABY4HDH9_9BACI|nr:MaoC family dehydratase N-terminal domain-containing protein [Halobacillus amylolyticus]UOR11465.1 MaoC family dehydratase N-terminal domain-containing protein [Halobacillus amylolyticus]